MPWKLRDNLYWCLSGGRPIFLDMQADRYFCLSNAAAPAFRRIAAGCQEPADLRELGQLIDDGLLIDDPAAIAGCRAPPIPPATSDLAVARAPGRLRETLRVIAAEILIGLLLRAGTLAGVVARCSAKPRRAEAQCQVVELETIARAASDASLILRATDRCLVRALAVHWLCRRRGIGTTIIFGVRTNPFGAHAWTQFDELVVTGEYEQARLYTPIAMFG